MRARGHRRDLGVDVVRGLALLSMYVAHVAPFDAPPVVREVSNLLTAALFATLVGVGFGLSSGRGSSRWVAPAVRGAALVATGYVLLGAGSHIIVVLVHLGLLTWAMAVVVRVPVPVVAALGTVLFVVSPLLERSVDDETGPGLLRTVLELTLTGDSYRLSALLAWAILGFLLARLVLPGSATALSVAGTVLLGAAAVGLGGLDEALTGGPVVPYSGTHLELALDALLAGGVLLLGVGLSRLAEGRGLGWLAAMGAMSLTLYALQVLVLGRVQQLLLGGMAPLGWSWLALLVAGSAVLAVGWQQVATTRRWGRGPLEGVVDRAVRLVAATAWLRRRVRA